VGLDKEGEVHWVVVVVGRRRRRKVRDSKPRRWVDCTLRAE
jgi:hypothetical protein